SSGEVADGNDGFGSSGEVDAGDTSGGFGNSGEVDAGDSSGGFGAGNTWTPPNSNTSDNQGAGSQVTKWGVPKNVTEKIPAGWGNKANKKGVGTRWQDPDNPGNGVRIDQGNPHHSLSSQQVDHVIVRRNGQVIGRDGKQIQGSIKDNAEQAHIPLNEYQNWKSWDSPL
ncbi:hypothetical protein, partial [Zooshikella harenae]